MQFLLCWIVCSALRFCLRHSIGCLPPFFSSFVRSAVYSSVRSLVFLPPARLVCHMRFFVVVSRALCSYPHCPACPTHSVLSPVVLASLNHAPRVSLPPPRPCSRTHHRPRTSPAFARRVSGERASFKNYVCCSTRSALQPPGGNQVDGLPPARHTAPQ